MVSSITILSSIILWAVLDYRQQALEVEKIEFDLNTVTASDYTLEIRLSSKHQDFLKSLPDLPGLNSQGMIFKLNLIKIIEDRMKELEPVKNYKVADLNFAFLNGHIVRLLQ